MKKLFITIKQSYGNTLLYPACEDSKTLAAIAGTKTLTDETLTLARKLGYEFYEQPRNIKGIKAA